MANEPNASKSAPTAGKANSYFEWEYANVSDAHSDSYLLPRLFELSPPPDISRRVLDVGCGKGSIAGHYLKRGYSVVGVDLSRDGIAIARETYPSGRFEVLGADENVLTNLNEDPFDLVISTEVVEHLADPRSYARGCYAATKPGGRFICTTPYHGYLKNLLISLTGQWDHHMNPMWDGGHIKLWSRSTLSQLLRDAGFVNLQFRGAGRAPFAWMSMVMCGERPGG